MSTYSLFYCNRSDILYFLILTIPCC